jgi:F-type H+-transporting ATPase subunit b
MEMAVRALTRRACEKALKLARRPASARAALAVCALAVMLGAGARRVAAQPEHAAAPAGEAEGEKQGSEAVAMIARLVNFALLAGGLVYLLKSPIASYLSSRSEDIRSDLVTAADTRRTAAAEIAEIDRRMQALPGELAALREQGAREIADEEARIRAAAAAERDRLLEQARRDIDLQVKIAERELVSHAATLAVGVATDRIKRSMTDDDQQRLVDRYVRQLH